MREKMYVTPQLIKKDSLTAVVIKKISFNQFSQLKSSCERNHVMCQICMNCIQRVVVTCQEMSFTSLFKS